MNDTETVRKIYVRDLHEKQRVETVFRVTEKARHTARSGKAFLTLTLVDRTGTLDGRVFDNLDAVEPAFAQGDYVLVTGQIISFHKKLQLVIESLARLEPEPIDPLEFTPPPEAPRPPEAAPPPQTVKEPRAEGATPEAEDDKREPAEPKHNVVKQIRELVERVQDPNVRALLLAFLDDPEIAKGLPIAAAAKGIHHAYPGGLADHILSVMRLANRLADHYPMADRDLLIAGALLHDIGKVQELRSGGSGAADYTDEGRLVGHLVITAQKIHLFARHLPHFPPLLEQHLTHLVLAHHGQLAYGSPKEPVTLEAYLVHMMDTIDSRVASWLELMQRDPNETWTERTKLYDRHLWKGVVPTSRNRAPVEPRRRRSRGERRQGKGPGPGAPTDAPRQEPAKITTFKPLTLLEQERS